MGRPRLIILIRHAQSEGNKNRDIHQTIPDHRVKLTQEGWQQAYEAGRRLRAMLRPDDTLHFFTSPYRRTRETTEGILATLTSDEPETSPFKRDKIKVYEEPRLREQDFGNFQPCSAEMERMWQERADYGHFFYRIPNGESAADAYDRISGFNESLWRQFGEDDFASVCVLVTHGLMSRVFLMKWYHFSVEYFEDLRNVNHCEFLIMRRNDAGKYILENKLRTWSELKRERAEQLEKERGENGRENGISKDVSKLVRTASIKIERRWGGCPNGCNHDKNFRIRSTLADLVKSDHIISSRAVGLPVSESASGSSTPVPNRTTTVNGGSSAVGLSNASFNGTGSSQTIVSRRPAAKRFLPQTSEADGAGLDLDLSGPHIDVTKARDEIVSSPDGTPSFISVDDRLRSRIRSPNAPPRPLVPAQLHVGRDFGGTYSGHNTSDVDSSSSDDGDECIVMSSTTTTATVTTSTTTNLTANGTANGNTISNSNSTTPKPSSLGLLPTPALPHRPHHHRDTREQSRMGRGMRANRLGDHHSSDGEHEADGEHEEDEPCCSGRDGAGEEESSGAEEMTDEADEVEGKETPGIAGLKREELEGGGFFGGDNNGFGEAGVSREEAEERSVRGSVY
ncbi:hypothetical protein VTI74DRAFT_11297 [Chaetomium olivicolor]